MPKSSDELRTTSERTTSDERLTTLYGSDHYISLSRRSSGAVRAGCDRCAHSPQRGDCADVDRTDSERGKPEPGGVFAYVGKPPWAGILDLCYGRRRRRSCCRPRHFDRLLP